MIMIEIAGRDRIEELKDIWRVCFDDSEEYIDFFMEHAFDAAVAVAYICDEKAVGAAYLFPCVIGRAGTRAYYWYAIGVLPDYRKKGIFSEMVDFLLALGRREGRKSFCFAMPELRGFYSSKGLDQFYYSVEVHFGRTEDVLNLGTSCDMPDGIQREELSAKEYGILRREAFLNRDYIRWEDDYLAYAIKEKRFCQGICDKLLAGNKTYAVIGEIQEQRLNIEETTMNCRELQAFSNQLCRLYGVSDIYAQIPDFFMYGTDYNRKFSGLGNMGAANVWIALTLL